MPEKGRLSAYQRDGLSFEVRDSGPPDGPPVLLLHGFPQDSTCWDAVVPLLTANGNRTLTPDQRGYSKGARPRGRTAYRQIEFVRDVVALLDAAGIDKLHLVGHDWGGFIAWAVAARHPERVSSLTVLSTPHPAAFVKAMRHGQAARSWYFALLQLPVVPELILRPRARIWSALGQAVGESVAQHYMQRLAEPGATTAALNWYRAIPLDARRPSVRVGRISVPTQYLWGERDPFLGRAAAERTADYVHAPYWFRPLPRAGHWLPERNPQQVAEAIMEWGDNST